MFRARLRGRARLDAISSKKRLEVCDFIHYARLFVFVPHKTRDNKSIVRPSVCCFLPQSVCRSHILVKLLLIYQMS